MRLLSHGCLTLHWVPTVSQERAVAARVASAKKNRKGKFWILFQTGVSNSVKKALNHCLGFSGKVFQENLELKNNQHLCHQCIHLPSFAKPSKEVQSKPPKTQQPERPKTAQNGPKRPKRPEPGRFHRWPGTRPWHSNATSDFQVWAVWAPNSSKHICHTPWLMP